MKIKNTLIIEDTELDKFILEYNIQTAEISENIIHFPVATEALSFLEAAAKDDFPELIFLDLNMPEMSGLEFLQAFNLLPEDKKEGCKIVVLSSSKDAKDIQKTTSSKYVFKYTSKPVLLEHITQIAREIESHKQL